MTPDDENGSVAGWQGVLRNMLKERRVHAEVVEEEKEEEERPRFRYDGPTEVLVYLDWTGPKFDRETEYFVRKYGYKYFGQRRLNRTRDGKCYVMLKGKKRWVSYPDDRRVVFILHDDGS